MISHMARVLHQKVGSAAAFCLADLVLVQQPVTEPRLNGAQKAGVSLSC